MNFIKKHIIKPLLLGITISILLTLIFNLGPHFTIGDFIEQLVYSVILTFLFWKGNEAIRKYLTKNISWLEKTRRRVFTHVLMAVSYSLLIILLFYLYVWFTLMHKPNLNGFYIHFRFGIYICFSINLIVILTSYSLNFFRNWKNSVLNEERLKRESLALQYESLKNQVNPHFLFNSLNVLTSLIERDSKASVQYVKQLADVFRYVLDQNVKELVPIETEMKFIKSYIFLQQIRFGDNLKTMITVKDDFSIVPIALQILIENAVKHNEVSAERPLSIKIYEDEQYLMVENNIQLRNYLPDSNQLGLKTLEFQYEFLSGKKVEVISENDTFVVKIPKIKNEEHAGIGH